MPSSKKRKKKEKKQSSLAANEQSAPTKTPILDSVGEEPGEESFPSNTALTKEYATSQQASLKTNFNNNQENKPEHFQVRRSCTEAGGSRVKPYEAEQGEQASDVAAPVHGKSPETNQNFDKKTKKKKHTAHKDTCGAKQPENDCTRNTVDVNDNRVDADLQVKESSEEKTSSPSTTRNKKKKRKSKGILLSDVDLTERQSDSDKERSDKKVDEEEKKALCDTNDSSSTAKSDLKTFPDDNYLLEVKTKERNNFSKFVTLLYNTGLDTLRRVFKQIHPSWSNKPDDAKNLDKGKMKLQKHELARFNTGDINSWDISLITTVLLYSKKCYKAISKKKKGFENAIHTITTQKNNLVSHKDSEKMTDDEFHAAWDLLSKCLVTIGASSEETDDIFADDILVSAKFYRDLFLKEVSLSSAVVSQVNKMHTTVQEIHSEIQDMPDKVVEKLADLLSSRGSTKSENTSRLQDLSGPKFTEWLQFCDKVKDFDYGKNNYILITDTMAPENLQYFSVLRSVPWKIVLDFNPASEEHGMYHDFVNKEGKNSIFDMITPGEIRSQHSNLARNIDPLKTKWLFVKGREKDNLESDDIETFLDWKSSSVKHISRFFSCCSDPGKLDSHKPLICLILPFQKESIPFLELTMNRLCESFDEFKLQFAAVNHDCISELQSKFNVFVTDLCPRQLNSGLENLLKVSTGKGYRLPTFQAKLPVKLTHDHFLYLQQYLDILYDGCEDLPTDIDDEAKLEQIFNEHRESFLSGNWISFVSLYDHHDAKREVGEEVRSHIQRLLDQGPTHSTIVEIRHLPGTGGTTIARRVLWDLHKSYPCAIARLDNCKHDFDEDTRFINDLADRISDIHETCQTFPLILLDGKHPRIEAFSNKLVRTLNGNNQRAVLLRCLHRPKQQDEHETNPDTSGINARFNVKVRLEDSKTDLNQFKEKYKGYIDEFKKTTNHKLCLSRVFHFPLIAMLKGLEGFNSKLKQIVHDSFDEMDGLQKLVAAVVAFIQHYAAQETPAFLLYKAFKKDKQDKRITYEEINHELITEQLLNLMVPEKPAKEISSRARSASVPEKYTLQHPLVADMVLERYYKTQKRDVFAFTREFLDFPIFQDDQFIQLIDDLFIKRSHIPKERFSMLFEALKRLNQRAAAETFRDLAEKAKDAVVFAHAALFHAKMNYFEDAINLISKAFECNNAKARSRIIQDRKGQVLLGQLKFLMKKGRVESMSKLEELADAAVRSFKKARNWPPTYASPLMGEVKVWIACIEWIAKNECNGDTDKAFEFITSSAPSFFHTCIGDSLYLLDIVDIIVQKEPNIPEPEETQNQANKLRLSLLKTFNKGKAPGKKKKGYDIIQACKVLCSIDKFPKSSQDELKRLQVHFILGSVDGQIELLQKEEVLFLLNLLEVLVLNTQASGLNMACHLMKVSLHISGPLDCVSLDKGLRVADEWIKESSYDPQPYFYQMMINFLKILDGNQLTCRDSYNKAFDMCRENSKNHCRGSFNTHFIKNTGEGLNRLMTRITLLNGEPDYRKNLVDFWTTQSRKKLLECSGRIRHRLGKSKQIYIELLQGNIELYVGKSADIGKVERNFIPGSIVYFVVGFNLKGPVANGITFQKSTPEH